MIPTVGFNMRKITKGNVSIKVCVLRVLWYEMELMKLKKIVKIWDIGGQPRFRTMWERYCRGVNAIM